jgi:hypothetical protein
LVAANVPASGHRYVWVTLPGVTRVIGICEVQVLRPSRWAWRQLSGGLYNAAIGKQASQSSIASIIDGVFKEAANTATSYPQFAEASRAIDGITTNDARSQSCAITDCDGDDPCVTVVPGAFQEWRVNLNTPTSVKYLKIWPAVFDGQVGPKHGGPIVLPNRTREWVVSVGMSSEPELNTQCTGGPIDFSENELADDGSLTIPCAAKALFVIIRKYSGGYNAGGTSDDGDNAVSVCEVQVWAELAINTPSPRAGHAAAGFRGHLMIWGGYDASGYLLNDLHMFRMPFKGQGLGSWTSFNRPLGTLPGGRSYARITPLGNNFMAISGGLFGSKPSSEVFTLNWKSCPAPIITGVQQPVYCRQGGVICQYTCAANYISNNVASDGWLACNPNGGFSGVNPPCSASVPSEPQNVRVLSTTSTKATVAWDPPASTGGLGASKIEYYYVYTSEEAGGAEWFDVFDGGESKLKANYNFFDPTANLTTGIGGSNRVSAEAENLRLQVIPNMDCFTRVNLLPNCPFLYYNSLPSSISIDNIVFQTSIRVSGESLNVPRVLSGLSLVDSKTGLLQFIVGIEFVEPFYYAVWQSFFGTSPGRWRNLQKLTFPNVENGVQIQVKLEISSQTSAFGSAQAIEAFYKIRSLDLWTSLGRPASVADLVAPAAQPTYYLIDPSRILDMRAAMTVRNYQTLAAAANGRFAQFEAEFDFLRISRPQCNAPGESQIVPGTVNSVDIKGLTPGTAYKFEVAASNDINALSWGYWGPSAIQSTPPSLLPAVVVPSPDVSTLVKVLKNKRTYLRPYAMAGSRADMAFDDQIASTLYDINGAMQCATSYKILASDVLEDPTLLTNPIMWIVDLEQITYVKAISIFIAGDQNPASFDGFKVMFTDNELPVNYDSFTTGQTCLEYGAKPYSLNREGYNATFACEASGRFMALVVKAQVNTQISICEVSVYTENKCPARPSTASVVSLSSDCGIAGGFANYGAYCEQTCAPGYVQAKGAANASCIGNAWSEPQLFCEIACPALDAPEFTSDCYSSYFYEDFNGNPIDLKARWYPADRRQGWDTTWFYNVGNYIVEAASRRGCNEDLLLINSQFIDYNIESSFIYETVWKSSDAAGMAFRIVDGLNYYRMVSNPRTKSVSIEKVIDGTAYTIASRGNMRRLDEDTYYKFILYVEGPEMNVTMARWEGDGSALEQQLVLTGRDSTFTAGGAGLFAQTWAKYQLAHLYGRCNDKKTCGYGVNNDECVFFCADGFNVAGSQVRRCVVNSTDLTSYWSGTPLQCVHPFPIFRTAAVSCPENLKVGDQCGEEPMQAYTLVPDSEIWYSIIGGNTDRNNAVVFYMDECSGTIRIRNQTSLREENRPLGQNFFTLTIQARVRRDNADYYLQPGNVLLTSTATVTVVIENSIDTPDVPSSQTLFMDENALPRTLIGRVQAFDVNQAIRYEQAGFILEGGLRGANKHFTIDYNTGDLYTAPAPKDPYTAPFDFNYETDPSGVLTLYVRVERVWNPEFFKSGTVYIEIRDRNDPPRTGEPYYTFDSAALRLGAASGAPPVPLIGSNLYDEDIYEDSFNSFKSLAAPPLFEIVSPSLWASLPLYNPCKTFNIPTGGKLATADGTTTGVDVFEVLANNQLAIKTSVLIPTDTPIAVAGTGVLADDTFYLCISGTDTSASPPSFKSYELIPVIAKADEASLNIIQGCSINGGLAYLSTKGNQFITCSYSGILPTTLTATYKSSGSTLTFTSQGDCIFSPGTPGTGTFQCTTSPGVGVNLVWSFFNLGIGIAVKVPFETSYDPPAVASVNYTSLWPCTTCRPNTLGGDVITLVGTNFGANSITEFDGSPAVNVLFVQTVITGQRTPPAAPYVCTYIAARSSDTSISCVVPTGVGNQMTIRVEVGNAVAPQNLGYRYTVPVITSVTLEDPKTTIPDSLETEGGQILKITGSNFGPGKTEQQKPFVTFGGTDGRLQTFLDCTHDTVDPHSIIRCKTLPSQGADLRIVVTIGGQSSVVTSGIAANFLGISYKRAAISSVYGPGVTSASTRGGQIIYIEGDNFPPVTLGSRTLQRILLTYGPGIDRRFTATQCIVTKQLPAKPTIQCLSAQGTGKMDSFILAIDLVPSIPFVPPQPCSYEAPVVIGISGAGVSGGQSTGNSPIVITGSGFGPNDVYTRNALSVYYGLQNRGANTTDANLRPINFRAQACTITIPHQEITCQSAPGVGAGLTLNVMVNGLASTSNTLRYAEPTITGVYYHPGFSYPLGMWLDEVLWPTSRLTKDPILGDPNLFYALVVRGVNFGPGTITSYVDGSTTVFAPPYDPICDTCVTFGPTGTENNVYNPVGLPLGTKWHQSSTQIILAVGQGAGGIGKLRVRIQSGNQFSAVNLNASFQFAPPVWRQIEPRTADTISITSTGNTVVTLRATNIPFLDQTSKLVVNFGQYTPFVQNIIPTDLPTSAAQLATIRNPDGSYNIQFEIPLYFGGQNIPITVSQVRSINNVQTTNLVLDADPAFAFNFNEPVIEDIVIKKYPMADKGKDLCRDASNFGPLTFPVITNPTIPTFTCNPSGPVMQGNVDIYKITILGKNFLPRQSDICPTKKYSPLTPVPPCLTTLLPNGVTTYIEILNTTSRVNATAAKWLPSIGDLANNGGPVQATMPECQYNQAGLRRLNPADLNFVFAPSYSCTYQASLNTFRFLDGWSDSKIEIYTTIPEGEVRIRHVSNNYFKSRFPGGVVCPAGFPSTQVTSPPSTCDQRIASSIFSGINPDVAELQGATTNIPTTGALPQNIIRLLVPELGLATDISILIGNGDVNSGMPRTNCPLVKVGPAPNYDNLGNITNPLNEIIKAQLTSGLDRGIFWTVGCIPPAGQGVNQRVAINRTIGGRWQLSFSPQYTVSYAQPEIDSFISIETASVPAFLKITSFPRIISEPKLEGFTRSNPITTFTTPTSRMFIVGRNLGINPKVSFGTRISSLITPLECDKFTGTLSNTTTSGALGKGTHTCYYFSTNDGLLNYEGGEGNGLESGIVNKFPMGFLLKYSAGNDALASFQDEELRNVISSYSSSPIFKPFIAKGGGSRNAFPYEFPFSYASPVITSITTNFGLNPEISTGGNSSLELTLLGYNFGTRNFNTLTSDISVRAFFGYTNTKTGIQSGWNECRSPVCSFSRLGQNNLTISGIPPGGGKNIAIKVQIGNVEGISESSLSYSPPVIEEAYSIVFAPNPCEGFDLPLVVKDFKTYTNFTVIVNTTHAKTSRSNATYVEWIPINATLFSLNTGLVPKFPCSGDRSNEYYQRLRNDPCTGEGIETDYLNVTRWKSQSWAETISSPLPNPSSFLTFGNSNDRMNAVNDKKFSDSKFLTDILTSAKLSSWVSSCPGNVINITNINGGIYNPVSKSWKVIPFDTSGPRTTSLTLTGPSRVVNGKTFGSTSGTTLIVIKGRNFGPGREKGDDYSCPMLSWSNRNKGISALDCNLREDFVGEGELPRANILQWNNTPSSSTAIFLAGPGIGIKDVEIVVFGQSQESLPKNASERVLFRYDAPIAVPKLMYPPKVRGGGFKTDGTGQVPLKGIPETDIDRRLPSFTYLNLPTIQTGSTKNDHAFLSFNGCCRSIDCDKSENWLGVRPIPCLPTSIPFASNPNSFDPVFLDDDELVYKLPTAIFIFVFSNAEDDFAMVTDFRNVDGTAHPALIVACKQYNIPKDNCITERLDRFSRADAHTFSFVPPLGVGDNINVDLQVWDVAGPIWTKRAVHTNKYLEPFVSSLSNNPLFLGDSREDQSITFRGVHFGTDKVTLPPRMIDNPNRTGLNPRDLIAYTGSDNTIYDLSGQVDKRWNCKTTSRIQSYNPQCYADVNPDSRFEFDSLGSSSDFPRQQNVPLDAESCYKVDIECKLNSLNAKVGNSQPYVRVANQISVSQRDSFRDFPNLIIACKPGFFSGIGGSCLPCPYEGAVCRGYDSSRDNILPEADPNFKDRFYQPAPLMGWFDFNSTYLKSPFYKEGYSPSCPESVRVLSLGAKRQELTPYPNKPNYRDVCIIPCHNYYACVDENDKSYSPLSNNMCATGYASVPPYWRCAVCDVGYFMKSGVCQKCKDDATLAFLMIGYIGLILFAIIIAWLFSKYEIHVALFSIGFDFMQTIAMLGTSKVVWGENVNSLFWVLSASYLDIEIIQPECYSYTKQAGYSPTQLLVDKFYAVLWLPVAIVFGLACIHFGISAFNTLIKKQRFEIIGRHAPALVSCSILVVSLLYMYETENLLQVFNCSASVPPVYANMYPGTESTDATERALALAAMSKDWRWQRYNVIKYMHTIPEECVNYYNFKGTQLDLLPWAMTWMVVGVAGWPIGIAIWLRINRMTIMEDQLLRAKGTGNDRLTGPETFDFRRTWGRLYYQFRPDCWYWQVIIYLRKLIFLIVMLYSWNQNGGYQMVGCSIVLMCFYVLHVRISPFMGPDTYEEVLRDHQNKSMTSILHARLRTAIQGIETKGLRNNRKNVVQYDGSVNRSAVLGFVLSSLFDYNTVEAILLFVTIMICNLGIVTELHSAFYNDSPDSASYGIVFLVTVSLIYYFSVAIWDAILAAAAKSQATLELKRRRSSKSMRSMRKAAAGEEEEPQFMSSSPAKKKVGLFNDFSRQLVDRITSSDTKSTLASMRKQSEQQDAGPVEVSINPLMASNGSKRNLKSTMDNESNERMPAMPNMPPPPEAMNSMNGFSNMSNINIAPGDLQAMAQALQQFPQGPPPELWSSFRSAFDDAVGLTFAKDREISDLKQLMAEKDAMVRELQSLQSQQPQLSSPLSFGSSFRASAAPASPQSTAFSGTNQALARQASQASMRQFATAQQKALKPQKRNSYAPTTSDE